MRRMIPENQQEALKKLTSKEALLGQIIVGGKNGIASMTANIDSDGFTYVHISGQAVLTNGEDESFEVLNIPAGMRTAESYVATNDNGDGVSVTVSIVGTNAEIMFNPGAVGRTVYFSILLSKFLLEI